MADLLAEVENDGVEAGWPERADGQLGPWVHPKCVSEAAGLWGPETPLSPQLTGQGQQAEGRARKWTTAQEGAREPSTEGVSKTLRQAHFRHEEGGAQEGLRHRRKWKTKASQGTESINTVPF